MSQIIIKAHQTDISPRVNDYVEKKMAKLDTIFDKVQLVQVDLDIDSVSNKDDRYVVSVSVTVPGTILVNKESSNDWYAGIDTVIDKLQRQLKAYKQKLRLKSRKEAMKTKRTIRSFSLHGDHAHDDHMNHVDDSDELYIKKPMYPEDAAMMLEERDTSFLVFRNATNEKINVIYVAQDGNFGLIDT
jgi:putative sigma-54 modulation protein